MKRELKHEKKGNIRQWLTDLHLKYSLTQPPFLCVCRMEHEKKQQAEQSVTKDGIKKPERYQSAEKLTERWNILSFFKKKSFVLFLTFRPKSMIVD